MNNTLLYELANLPMFVLWSLRSNEIVFTGFADDLSVHLTSEPLLAKYYMQLMDLKWNNTQCTINN